MADMFEGFVEVYSTATGAKQMVPEHFVGDPILGNGLSLTPSAQSAVDVDPTLEAGNTYVVPEPSDSPEGDPSDAWTVPQLTGYADDHGIDLAGATKKADVLTAITDHLAAGGANTGAAAGTDTTEGA